MAAIAVCTSVPAAPAPWYKWQSKSNHADACAQTSPGEGWEKTGGPYKDARCTIAGRPGQS